jgi:chemotaxis protein CheC
MKLSAYQEDSIAEAVNIGIGRAAACLSEMVGAKVLLDVPRIRFCAYSDACKQVSESGGDATSSVVQEFDGDISGSAAIVLSDDDAITLAQLLQGKSPTSSSLDILQQGILEEVGNIILNGVLGSLSNLMGASLSYSTPKFQTDESRLLGQASADVEQDEQRCVLLADTRFDVRERSIAGSLLLVFEVGSVGALVEALDHYTV